MGNSKGLRGELSDDSGVIQLRPKAREKKARERHARERKKRAKPAAGPQLSSVQPSNVRTRLFLFDENEHFARRVQQRRFDRTLIEFIYEYGEEFRGCNAISLTIVTSRLPPDVDKHLAERALGWIIVLNVDMTRLITVYRRQDAVSFLKMKCEQKYYRRSA